MATLEQKIAQKEDELTRLKEQSRKLETAQKVVIGGLMLSLAKNDTERAKTLLKDIKEGVTRKADLDRLQDVIEQLTDIIKSNDKQAVENVHLISN